MKHITLLILGFLFLADLPLSAAPPPPGKHRGPAVHHRPAVRAPVNRRVVGKTLRVAPRRVAVAPAVRRPLVRPLVRPRVLAPRVVVAPRVPVPIVPVRRVYHPERSIVEVETEGGQTEEMPYVAVPVMFASGSADFADAESYKAVEDMANVVQDVLKESPEATFDVEGHTSTDGSAEENLDLSARRAKRVYDELTLRYGINPEVLSAHGHGESYAVYPGGSEDELQLDRRVLLVRTK